MNTLIIQHVPGDEPRFCVVRQRDGKRTAEPAAIPPPSEFKVEGRPDSNLVRELRWYLEQFLGYPFPPETEHVDRVLEALRQWGRPGVRRPVRQPPGRQQALHRTDSCGAGEQYGSVAKLLVPR